MVTCHPLGNENEHDAERNQEEWWRRAKWEHEIYQPQGDHQNASFAKILPYRLPHGARLYAVAGIIPAQMPKKCTFCTKPADSREHIFSDWMIRMLPRTMWHMNERLNSGEYVSYKGKKVKMTARVVCGECNNGWMSQLEDQHAKVAMQHLLLGNNVAMINFKDMAAIAAYAFKTTVLANHKSLTRTPFFSPAERFRFRRTLQIPNGVQVWIACRKSIRYRGVWTSSFGKFNKKDTLSFSYYVCTWNFGNVVLQLLAGKWDSKERRKTIPFPGVPQSEYWKHGVVQIWPLPISDVEFPPPKVIGDDTFEAFSDRWETIDTPTLRAMLALSSENADPALLV
jgi:hypothetical protein